MGESIKEKCLFYNDDDDESGQLRWKTSELMQGFAKQYFGEPSNVKDIEITETKSDLENLAALAEDDRTYKLAQSKSEYLQEIESAVGQLHALAKYASKHNNEKATYLIERSVNEIKAILDDKI